MWLKASLSLSKASEPLTLLKIHSLVFICVSVTGEFYCPWMVDIFSIQAALNCCGIH